MKKILLILALCFGFAFSAKAQFIIQGPQGGTNLGSATGGSVGQCLKVFSVSPLVWTIGSCGPGGGGGGGGTFSTSTSNVSGELVNYPNNTTDIVVVGATATTGAPVYIDPNISLAKFFNQYFGSSSTTLQRFTFTTATGTSATTTNIFSTTASTTNLSGTNISGFGLISCTGTSALTFSGNGFTCTAQPQGTVTSVTGTSNRITSSGGATPAIDISASYVGQSSITTLGTIGTGVWNGTAIANANLANSTISGVALGLNLNSLSHDSTLTGTSYNGSAGVSDWGFNLTNPNTWTGKQTFTNASSSLFSTAYASSTQYFGANLATCNSASNALTWAAGVFGCNSITGGSGAAYPFQGAGNSTSTLTQFLGGLIASNSTSTNATTTTLAISSLATPAGTLLATDPNGDVIATTTPSGGTGTPGGSSNQFQFNNAGTSFGGASTLTTNGGNIGVATSTAFSPFSIATSSVANAAFPIGEYIGDGNGLTNGSASGTFLGMRSANAFAGDFIDIQKNGTKEFTVTNAGNTAVAGTLSVTGNTTLSGTLTDTAAAVNFGGGNLTLSNLGATQIVFNTGSAGVARIGGSATDGVLLFGPTTAANLTRIVLGTSDSNVGLASQFPAIRQDAFPANALSIVNANGTDGGYFGVGTSSPGWLTEFASSTAPQLDLSDGSVTDNGFTFRNEGGTLAIGTSSPSTFATSSVDALKIDKKGNIYFGGDLPSGLSCGSGATFAPGSNNNAGRILVGSTVAQTTCNFTFADGGWTATANAPACDANTEGGVTVFVGASSTPTALSMTALSSVTGDTITYQCHGF